MKRQQTKSPTTNRTASFFDDSKQAPPLTPPSRPHTPNVYFPQGRVIKNDITYTPEQILELKPDLNRVEFTPLKSTGFVILLKQFEDNSDPTTRRHNTLRLRIHKDRFIPSILRKKYVNNDPAEELKIQVQTCLNRLNSKNKGSIIEDLQNLKANHELIIKLLLDRATVDEDSPEKNRHLRNFANFAIDLSTINKDFKKKCMTMSLAKYDELISDLSHPLNEVECIIVWISYLVIGEIIPRKQYFKRLAMTMKLQPGDNAVDLIRASLFTCGKVLDERKWTEVATFYYYMNNNPPKSGYLLFLYQDLVKLRNSRWDEQFFLSSVVSSRKKARPALDDDALKDILFESYISWRDDPSFGTPRVPPQADIEHVITAVIQNLEENIDDENYARWVGLLIANAEIDAKKLPELFQKNKSLVAEAKLPSFFTVLGGLYDSKIISFADIANLGVLTSSAYVDALGKATYVDQKEISDALYNNENGNKGAVVDDAVIAALVLITDWSETQDKNTLYGKAVEFSRVVFGGIEEADENTEPTKIFDGRKQYIIQSAEGINKALLNVIWNHIIADSKFSTEFEDKAKKYFVDLNL